MWAKTIISGFGVGLRMRPSSSSTSVRSFGSYNNKTPKSKSNPNPKPSFSWHVNNWSRKSFTTKASDNPGSIDSTLIQSMQLKIKEHLNAESVTVTDAYGDGRHVSIDVVSSAFEGKSAVNRQRLVYKAIWEELQSTVHAVDQMTTRTPAEAEPPK